MTQALTIVLDIRRFRVLRSWYLGKFDLIELLSLDLRQIRKALPGLAERLALFERELERNAMGFRVVLIIVEYRDSSRSINLRDRHCIDLRVLSKSRDLQLRCQLLGEPVHRNLPDLDLVHDLIADAGFALQLIEKVSNLSTLGNHKGCLLFFLQTVWQPSNFDRPSLLEFFQTHLQLLVE